MVWMQAMTAVFSLAPCFSFLSYFVLVGHKTASPIDCNRPIGQKSRSNHLYLAYRPILFGITVENYKAQPIGHTKFGAFILRRARKYKAEFLNDLRLWLSKKIESLGVRHGGGRVT